jgi:hypothetical protein
MFSSPEAIILFGGLTKAGDLILKPTRGTHGGQPDPGISE